MAVSALGLAALVFRRHFDPDEFEHLQFAWMLDQGLVPYRDFFEHHTPLFHLLLQPAFRVFDAGTVAGALALPYAFRAVAAALALATAAATWLLAARVAGRATAVLASASLLGSRVFMHSGVEIRGDQLAALALVACAGALLRAFAVRGGLGRGWLALAGAAATLAVLATQKALFALPGLSLAALLLARGRGALRPAALARIALPALAGAALAAGPVLAFFATRGALGEFVYCNFLLNAAWTREGQLGALLNLGQRLGGEDPLLVVLAGFGLWGLTRAFGADEDRERSAAVLLPLASLLAGLAVIPIATPEYAFLLAPFAAIAAAQGALRLAGSAARLVLPGLAAVILATAGLHLAQEALAFDAYDRDPAAPLRRLAYVVGQTPPEATILPGWLRSSGVALRRPAFYYHMPHAEVRAQIPAGRYAELLAGLRSGTVRPELVSLDEDLAALPAELVEFLRTHYEPTGIDPVLRRRPE
jgi:4-amino-4-deoxy-L-arabinose transferase-like glycosyltransferase